MKKSSTAAKKRKQIKGYLFIAPMIILLAVFTIYPMIFSFIISFTDWNFLSGLEGMKWNGIQNYLELPQDIWFRDSICNTVEYTLLYVPATMVISFILACFLNNKVFGAKTLRLFYFIPYISSISAVSILWTILYSPSGPIASFLERFGITAPNFLADITWALPAITLMSVWMNSGYCALIYVAGMQGIPKDVLESAEIDGATGITRTLKITLPLLSKTTFFLLITQMINSFKVFSQIQIMTGGGPVRSTTVLGYYIYQSAFVDYRFGYASSMAVILFIVILIFTLLQTKFQKKIDY